MSSNSDADDPNDRLPINAELMDSSDGPIEGRANSSMNISFGRSGEKCKGKQTNKTGKEEFGARKVSEYVDNLATASKEFALVFHSKDKGVMTILKCVFLLSTGLVVSGDEIHLFALWFFRDNDN